METTLCYIECEGKYLMMLRNKKHHDPSQGKWIGVGGKLLPGESPQDCLLREVREETGFTLTSWQDCGIVDFLSDQWEEEIMHLYRADAFQVAPGTPLKDGLPLPECSEGHLAWIPKDEVMALKLWEGDRLFLKRLIDGETDASMTLRYEGDTLVEARTGCQARTGH